MRYKICAMDNEKVRTSVLDSIKVYRREKRAGVLKKLKSLKDLVKDKGQTKGEPCIVNNFKN